MASDSACVACFSQCFIVFAGPMTTPMPDIIQALAFFEGTTSS
jgi:hypothetical protein